MIRLARSSADVAVSVSRYPVSSASRRRAAAAARIASSLDSPARSGIDVDVLTSSPASESSRGREDGRLSLRTGSRAPRAGLGDGRHRSPGGRRGRRDGRRGAHSLAKVLSCACSVLSSVWELFDAFDDAASTTAASPTAAALAPASPLPTASRNSRWVTRIASLGSCDAHSRGKRASMAPRSATGAPSIPAIPSLLPETSPPPGPRGVCHTDPEARTSHPRAPARTRRGDSRTELARTAQPRRGRRQCPSRPPHPLAPRAG